jgi:molecular chaperone GrpE
VTRKADDPKSSPDADETAPDAPENISGPLSADEAAPDGDDHEPAEQLDLPLDAILDWGTDPNKAESELEAQAAEALVAAERDEYLEALQRLQADFDNFRKRSMRQQTDLLEHATEGLCVRLLPVLDALDLAIAHAVGTLPTEPPPAAIAAHAPSRGDTAKLAKAGKPAKAAAHSDGPTVVQVMRAGYRLKSKVLRPAMVFVGG